MTIRKRRRGRPPGTGIDDSAVLEQLRGMLRDDPSMKPTTAIRALGYENESVIRRLRDKLRQDVAAPFSQPQAQPVADVPRHTQGDQPHWTQSDAPRTPVQVQLLGRPRDPVKTQSVQEQAEPPQGDEAQTLDPDADLTNRARTIPVDLPFQALGLAITTANFFAVQNALWWQASLRRPPWGPFVVAKGQTCPWCGQTR